MTAHKPKDKRKRIGLFGEWLTASFLESMEWRVEAKRWRFGKSSEIDIVARTREQALVFVEVKTRRLSSNWQDAAASAFDTINLRKQKRLATMSQRYMIETRSTAYGCRFDIVFVGIEAGLYRQVSGMDDLETQFSERSSQVICLSSDSATDACSEPGANDGLNLFTFRMAGDNRAFDAAVLHIENAFTL